MQRESSIILNKVLLSILVSHKLIGKVVQERCWVLSRAEPSGCSQKGEFFISGDDFVCKTWRVPGSLPPDSPWSLIPDRQGFPFRLGFPWDCQHQRGFQCTKPVPPKFQGVLPTGAWAAGQLCQEQSQEFLQFIQCEQQTLPVFEDHFPGNEYLWRNA